MVTFEKLSSNKVKLTFKVEAEKFDAAIRRAYTKNAKRFNVPGFRRGKAPMHIIENFYGPSVFFEDALEDLFPEVYKAAIDEHKLEVVDQPELDVQQIGKGQDLEFTCEVYVKPDVELGEYKALGLEYKKDEVTEDDVTAEIERARDRASRYVDVTDRAAKLDDQVNIDYAGFDGEEQFEGGTANGHDLVLGSGMFIPGFEDQLVGATVGQELDVNVTFPEQYHAENLAGKPVVFKVKVNSIREKEMPELDEEFVKEVSETANTVEEYKAEIKDRLEKQAAARADMDFENQVVEKVTENAKVDIPAAMVEDQVTNMLRDMEMRLMYQGMRLADYMKYSGQTEEQLRGMYKPQAESRVKSRLVLEAIMKAEDIKADEEDVEKMIESYAAQNGATVEDFKKSLTEADNEYFAEGASLDKTVKFLVAVAKGE